MTDQAEPRRWWPEFMCDEVMPPGRVDPAEWLEIGTAAVGYVVVGRTVDGDDGFEFDGEVVQPGQVVEMHYCDFLGALDVALAEDGTFTAQGVPPEGFTQCWNRDEWESSGDNLLELIAAEREADPSARVIDVGFVRGGVEYFAVTLTDGAPGLDPVPANTPLECGTCGVVSRDGQCACRLTGAIRRAFRAETVGG